MKLSTIITTLTALVTPMAVVAQSEEMFGKYPYCTGCVTNYQDAKGEWYYTNNTWCKVNEEKCQAMTCKSVKGYPCCEKSTRKVDYVDFEGEWSVENKKWCLRNPLPEFTDVKMGEYESWVNTFGYDEEIKMAIFDFYIDDKTSFLLNYEIMKISNNDVPITIDEISLHFDPYIDHIRIITSKYITSINVIKMIIRNKKTNEHYIKEFRGDLSYFKE